MNSDTAWRCIRYFLMMAGAYFVGKKWLTADQLELVVAGLGTLFVTVWGIWTQWNTRMVAEETAKRPDVPTVSPVTGTTQP